MTIKPFTNHYNNIIEDSGVELLDTFSKNFEDFNNNLQKSKIFLEQFESISSELEDLVKRDEFEGSLASHILLVNEAIVDLKQNISNLKDQNKVEIQENIKNITNKINNVINSVNEEIKSQNKLIFDKSIQQDQKIDYIGKRVNAIDTELVEAKIQDFKNEIVLLQTQLDENIPHQNQKISNLSKNLKNKLSEISEKQDVSVSVFSNEIDQLNEKVSILTNESSKVSKELPKIKKTIVENITNVEEKFNEKILNGLKNLEDKVHVSIEETKSLLEEKVSTNVSLVTEKIDTIESLLPEQKSKIVSIEVDLDKTSRDVNNLKKLKLEEKIDEVKNSVGKIDSVLNDYNQKFNLVEDKIVGVVNKFSKTFNEEKYYAVNKKIEYLEEVLKKFNEKTVLTEDIYPNPS